jgi:ABC-type multidrug transport system permease subunit
MKNIAMVQLSYILRVIWACMRKDIKSSLTERSTLIQCMTLPVNYLILLSLFVLSGSNAPTAVVMQDTGPYAQAFYDAMSNAHSFRLTTLSAAEARAKLLGGQLVATVTIPPNFDTRLAQRQPVQVQIQVNNLNTDLTDDVRRAIHLSVTSFYAREFPNSVTIVPQEIDAYSRDTDYIPFLAISILVISLMVAGLLQAGMGAAREWEKETVKELLLAPVSPWTVLVGKMLGSLVMGLLPVAVVLAVLIIVVGDYPANFLLVVGVSLLTLLVFVAAGMMLGMALKQRMSLTTVTRAISVPLFFLSGIFGPITFSTVAVQEIARLFPTHYAIVLEQLGFKGFITNTLAPDLNGLILCGFVLLFVVLATMALRYSKITH